MMEKLISKKCALILFFSLLGTVVQAQVVVGISYGIQIPGAQDLKYRYYENGSLVRQIKTTEAESTNSGINSYNISYWMKNWGLRLGYNKWDHFSKGDEYVDDELPPIPTLVEESREALFLSILHKTKFPFVKSNKLNSMLGLGFGEALTDIERGVQQWRAAFQALFGASYKLTNTINVNFEFRYILTRDGDTGSKIDGWRIDTSGSWHLLRFGPHWDTKFHAFQLGLEWKVF